MSLRCNAIYGLVLNVNELTDLSCYNKIFTHVAVVRSMSMCSSSGICGHPTMFFQADSKGTNDTSM